MIKSIKIKNFMIHSDVNIDNIPKINLIIGKNDTGKTSLLKLLYSTVKSLEIHSLKMKSRDSVFKKELADKLLSTFMPTKNGLGELVQKGSKSINIDIMLNNDKYQQQICYSFGERTEKNISICTDEINPITDNTINALFIPSKEVLTGFLDIQNIRDKFYGVGFDDTYLDLIKSLNLPAKKDVISSEFNVVNKKLVELFEGKIEQTDNREQPFIFKKGNQQFTMQQTAEGIKKIGVLTTLIANQELRKNTILFMDEPETALHPDAIRKLIEMLVIISQTGVQVFLASHSYFVIKQLAICAKRDNINTLYWNLVKEPKSTVKNSFHNLSDGILPENAIIKESIDMFDQEIYIDLNT